MLIACVRRFAASFTLAVACSRHSSPACSHSAQKPPVSGKYQPACTDWEGPDRKCTLNQSPSNLSAAQSSLFLHLFLTLQMNPWSSMHLCLIQTHSERTARMFFISQLSLFMIQSVHLRVTGSRSQSSPPSSFRFLSYRINQYKRAHFTHWKAFCCCVLAPKVYEEENAHQNTHGSIHLIEINDTRPVISGL